MTGVSSSIITKGKGAHCPPSKGKKEKSSKIFILPRLFRNFHLSPRKSLIPLLSKYNFSSKFPDLKMGSGQIISDAELSDEIFSSEEASDFENYSHQKKNKTVISKKVN